MELHKKIKSAVRDLLYLLDQDYPRKPSIELVGNRYRMTSQERMVLYRGVFSQGVCEQRIGRRWGKASVQYGRCVIDSYNVFITIESYLQGRLVFRALDGYVRDVSGVYGSYSFSTLTHRTADLVVGVLQRYLSSISMFTCYLDSPVSRSGDFAAYLREKMKGAGIAAQVEAVKSPDRLIQSQHASDLIATSDSVLIDSGECCVDIPALVFSSILGKGFPDLQLLLKDDLPWLESLLQEWGYFS
jgi:hypothetical protein